MCCYTGGNYKAKLNKYSVSNDQSNMTPGKILKKTEGRVSISPWVHPFDPSFAPDLRQRIGLTRWSDEVAGDWSYGTSQQTLRRLVTHWADGYDWNEASQRLNALPHFRAEIDGFIIHFLHLKGKSTAPQPLLLMNGWPSSFVEYGRLAPMLTDPVAYGGQADSDFDVVIPALPGFGYSERPTTPNQVQTVELFHRLMTDGLHYQSYIAAGTDIGAGIATRLALAYPQSVRGIHVSAVVDPPSADTSPALTAEETAYQRSVKKWTTEEGAYQHLQSTRPQTAAYALNDSPAGLASWIVEKFRYWSDAGAELFDVFPVDMLIDNLNVYWSTQTIGSSMRYYYESNHFRAPFTAGDYVSVPTAICMWPRDLVVAPEAWAKRFYNVQRYSVQSHGGHFPAWEQPELYAADLRVFLLQLRSLSLCQQGETLDPCDRRE
jgi:microsomal epoxide hydrolase